MFFTHGVSAASGRWNHARVDAEPGRAGEADPKPGGLERVRVRVRKREKGTIHAQNQA